jgi:hypothetical protein
MKSIYLLAAFFFILFQITFTQPKLSLDKPSVDLGTMYSGAREMGKFAMKNIGNDTLRIFSVQPQCGCTTVKQPKVLLLPGESDIVELEFNSSGYHGKVEKIVSINTNDPSSPFVTVKLSAEVKEALQPISGSNMFWMNNAEIGKSRTQSMSMKNVSGGPIALKGDSVSSPVISIKMDKKILQPDDTLNIQVTIVPNKTGYSIEHFYILTNHKNQPRVEVRVTFIGIKGN